MKMFAHNIQYFVLDADTMLYRSCVYLCVCIHDIRMSAGGTALTRDRRATCREALLATATFCR